MSDTWESRMAARAAERKRTRDEQEATERATHRAHVLAAEAPIIDAFIAKVAAAMTDEELTWPHVEIGCACIGAPPELAHLSEPPCRCDVRRLARELRTGEEA